MRASIIVACGFAASACHAQVLPDVISMEVEASSRAAVQKPFDPLIAFESDFDDQLPFPSAEAEADVGGRLGEPRVLSTANCSGRGAGSTVLRLDAELFFQIEEPAFGTRTRVAVGSWRHHVVFDLDRPALLHLNVQPNLFDDIGLMAYEPGMLTGPDGVIVSGAPEPGLPSWIWLIDLGPGRYTFESFGDYQVSFEADESLSDRASHDVSLQFQPPHCQADLDGDGSLTIFDFLAFQNLFNAGDDRADFDGDGEFTIFDLLAFQNAFDSGCE
ncbi:MAG: hypothetical protein NCW75_06500 [Phycisphaera sp.]|nr:MAG: hypothetical protein NCW75_06500 [Phycisphaera sp.]